MMSILILYMKSEMKKLKREELLIGAEGEYDDYFILSLDAYAM